MKTMKLTYRKLLSFDSFQERADYLRLFGKVGSETFGMDRYINQTFYRSKEWRQLRNYIIARDDGYDLAMPDYDIIGKIYIHHLNPITEDDVINNSNKLFDPDNLVCVSFETHNYIHFGRMSAIRQTPSERHSGDTLLW